MTTEHDVRHPPVAVHKGTRYSGASFSECGRYRYFLFRVWDECRPGIVWIMLNPSTADENVLDPTLTRCMNYSKAWGFGAMEVVNLFALRSTDPKRLRDKAIDPVGPLNDRSIAITVHAAPMVVCAWGANEFARHRASDVARMLKSRGIDPYALRVLKSGAPAHPLYQKSDLRPVPYDLGLYLW